MTETDDAAAVLAGATDTPSVLAALRSAGLVDLPLRGDRLHTARWLSAVAAADGSAGLVLAMHIIHVTRCLSMAEQPSVARYLAGVRAGTYGYLGGYQSENRSGSPRRGGSVVAALTPDGSGDRVRITGRKRYATGSSYVTHALVSGRLPDGSTRTAFVDLSDPGVAIDETWDALGMRGTASNDMVFTDVPATLAPETGSAEPTWSLALATVYHGLAAAARTLLTDGRHLPPPPDAAGAAGSARLRAYAGEVELAWLTLDPLLWSAWSASALSAEHAAAVKVATHRLATTVVDLVGRTIGAASVWADHPWNRIYRDLRVGWHNSPGEHDVVDALGARLLSDTPTPGRV